MRKASFISSLTAIVLTACAPPALFGQGGRGIAWGPGSFDSIGEQIYFTGINGKGEKIRYPGGPHRRDLATMPSALHAERPGEHPQGQ